MLAANNVDIFHTATVYETEKQVRTITPDAADAARDLGRDRFYNVFAGRLGLPGNALVADSSDLMDQHEAERNYDLHNMTVTDVIALADQLRTANALTGEEANLLSYQHSGLPFMKDTVFANSPVAQFAKSLNISRGYGNSRTLDLIVQQQEQIRYLSDNNADPGALQGARAVLAQLNLLQTEQALYAQFDARRECQEQGQHSGPFGTGFDRLSIPPQLLTLFSA